MAIEVTGEAVVAAGLAGAGLPVVVNPAQNGEAAAGKAKHRNGYSIKDRVDRDVEDRHQDSM